jgi:hypothetical protein
LASAGVSNAKRYFSGYKKPPKKRAVRKEQLKICALLTYCDITCNRQKQNTFFVKRERKPKIVIKSFHRSFFKPSPEAFL